MEKYLKISSTSNKSGALQQKVPAKKGVKRKYKEDYIKYGFVASGSYDHQLPLCIICNLSLSNEALVPSKLSRHLETNHESLKDKPKAYFENLLLQKDIEAKRFNKYMKLPEKGLVASYKVAHLLAKRKKAHTDAESVIAPSISIIVETMLGSDAADTVSKVPLSNDTISRRIEDLSSDINDQIREHFDVQGQDDELSQLWALQVDESTDSTGKAHLLAFIRFVKNGSFVNQCLFCKELKTTARGEDIFTLVDENILSLNLQWKNCVSICTDGCPSMQGKNRGFVAYVRHQNPNVFVVHCMIHREALVFKTLPTNLHSVMKQVIEVVNFIKTRPLQSRLFTQLCQEMDSKFKCLLFHTEVRWLSRGKVLKRVCQLKAEICSFLDAQKKDFGFSVHDELWWLRVQFIADLFEKVNVLNSSLQGPSENTITATSTLISFDEKLSLWKRKVSEENVDAFPTVNKSSLKKRIIPEILNTLSDLQFSLRNYFPEFSVKDYGWVINPFGKNNDTTNLSTEEEEQLIELQNNCFYRSSFSEENLHDFWLSIVKTYPLLRIKAIKILLPFASSWLCEFGFSALTEIKSKKRQRLLAIDDEMRVCLTSLEPRFELICSKKQAQPSH